ncbi:MAG: PAS domain S-box protein [Spirochaetia bacterium]
MRKASTGNRAGGMFQAILESAPDPVRELYVQLLGAQSDLREGVSISDGAKLLYANEALSRMYGYTPAELMALPSLMEIIVPEERERLTERLEHRLAGETVGEFGETEVIGKGGNRIIVEYAVKPIRIGGKTLIFSIVRDITERRRAEESVRQLSGRLLQIQDEVQERIARELRIRIATLLEAVRAKLAIVRDSGIVFDWKTADALRESIDLAGNAAKEIRAVSRLMHPQLLEEAGLSEAIRWYLFDYTQQTGIKVALDAPIRFVRLRRDAERTLFRVVQEALANIQRHSGSRSASIRLREDGADIQLEVRDQGSGIPPGILDTSAGTVAISGVGIRGMVERMRELGGTLAITSSTAGTTVTATLPFAHAQLSDSA